MDCQWCQSGVQVEEVCVVERKSACTSCFASTYSRQKKEKGFGEVVQYGVFLPRGERAGTRGERAGSSSQQRRRMGISKISHTPVLVRKTQHHSLCRLKHDVVVAGLLSGKQIIRYSSLYRC
jgi:hypothetical protein